MSSLTENTSPKYTAEAIACFEFGGRTYFRSATAASSASVEDAKIQAKALARERAETAARGGKPEAQGDVYPYPERILVEPVLDRIEFTDSTGIRELGRITKNRYNSNVLNSYQIMFVDVDTRVDSDDATRSNRKQVRDGVALPDTAIVPEDAAMQALMDVVRDNVNLGFRIYATRAGLRYLCTTHLFDPTDFKSQELLRRLKSDNRYVTLCRVQKCFRARLTPKPWRCLVKTPRPSGFLARLFSPSGRMTCKVENFATCQFVDAVGAADRVLPEIGRIIELHDEMTEVSSGKPLA
ncbi:MAG: hypothetical protein LBV12_09590 [Puniceicoccales bacterium]|jgi:hypothetical protein|nr:hypothetical protein [Puniceicoccales bacterium]